MTITAIRVLKFKGSLKEAIIILNKNQLVIKIYLSKEPIHLKSCHVFKRIMNRKNIMKSEMLKVENQLQIAKEILKKIMIRHYNRNKVKPN